MESKKIKEVADAMLEDEAATMAKLLALRQPQPLDRFAERVQGRPCCLMPRGAAQQVVWRSFLHPVGALRLIADVFGNSTKALANSFLELFLHLLSQLE